MRGGCSAASARWVGGERPSTCSGDRRAACILTANSLSTHSTLTHLQPAVQAVRVVAAEAPRAQRAAPPRPLVAAGAPRACTSTASASASGLRAAVAVPVQAIAVEVLVPALCGPAAGTTASASASANASANADAAAAVAVGCLS